jgi:crooked neck
LKAIREEEEDGEQEAITRIREVYERAVANVPPSQEKRHWRRYIFLWLDYALFEELEVKVCGHIRVFIIESNGDT